MTSDLLNRLVFAHLVSLVRSFLEKKVRQLSSELNLLKTENTIIHPVRAI